MLVLALPLVSHQNADSRPLRARAPLMRRNKWVTTPAG